MYLPAMTGLLNANIYTYDGERSRAGRKKGMYIYSRERKARLCIYVIAVNVHYVKYMGWGSNLSFLWTARNGQI